MIPVIRGGKEYYTKEYYTIKDYKDQEIIKICKASLPIIYDALSRAKKEGFRNLWNLSIEELLRIVREAAKLFKSEVEIGKTVVDYETHLEWVIRSTGLPYKYVVSSFEDLLFALKHIEKIIKESIPFDLKIFDDLISGDIAFTPKGKVLAVVLPSNLPTPNFFWVLSQVIKYPVLLRPSTSEPFTSCRLSKSLYNAGLPAESNYYIPCSRDYVPEIFSTSDRGIIFGSKEIVEKYGGYENIKVFGPGNSKIFVDADYYSVDDVIEFVKKSMLDKGGRSCLNASQLFVSGDNAERTLKDIFDALSEDLPTEFEDPLSENAEIPAFSDKETAKKIAQYLKLNGIRNNILVEIDNIVYLKPTVVLCESFLEPLFVELPFQYMAMTTIPKDKVEKFLENSLVVSLFTEDSNIIKKLILNPTIRNIFIRRSTVDTSLLDPHEGNIISFLYDFKTVKGL